MLIHLCSSALNQPPRNLILGLDLDLTWLVVNASTIPEINNGNLNAPVVMMAEEIIQ